MKLLHLAALAALLAAPAARAQSNTRGFLLEGSLYGTSLQVESDEYGSGAGLGLRLGYGFTPLITAFIEGGGASIDVEEPAFPDVDGEENQGLGYFDLGVELNFGGQASRLRPYANVALSGAAVVVDVPDENDSVNIGGAGLTVGAGLRYFVTPTLGLNGGLRLAGGEFTQVEFDGDTAEFDEGFEFGIARVQFGLSWFPSRR